jgi:hypothetical protein
MVQLMLLFYSKYLYETNAIGTSQFGICQRFETGGSLDRRVKCRRVPQPRRVGARRSTKGGKAAGEREVEIPRPSCLSRAQGRVRLQ